MQAGEVVGGGAGLEGAPPKDHGPGGADAAGDGEKLRLRLHGAGPRHKAEVAAADEGGTHLDHGVRPMGGPGGQGQGLVQRQDGLHRRQGGEKLCVQAFHGALQQQHGAAPAGLFSRRDAHLVQVGQEGLLLGGGTILFQGKDHGFLPPSMQ